MLKQALWYKNVKVYWVNLIKKIKAKRGKIASKIKYFPFQLSADKALIYYTLPWELDANSPIPLSREIIECKAEKQQNH